MAITRTPRKVSSDNFTVKGVANGDYGVLIIPDDKSMVIVGLEGTAASATAVVGHINGGGVDGFEDGTITVGQQLGFVAGSNDEIFVTIAASTATTDLRINARTA